jgi:hypothetical protein
MNEFDKSVRRGLEFLYGIQTPNGNFPDGIFVNAKDKWIRDTEGIIFSASLITHSISSILQNKHLFEGELTARCEEIIKKTLDFFVKEMQAPGLWKFGAQNDKVWKNLPYDVDDTCCISYQLKNYNIFIRFGMNKNLILKNRNDKGLFYTWFLPPDQQSAGDVDTVVNVNALLYLGENDETKQITEYICNLVNNNKEAGTSYYYSEPLCLYYFISRAFAAGVKGFENCRESIIRKITARKINEMNEVFNAAAVSTLLNFNHTSDYDFSCSIKKIIDSQCENGSWKRHPFYQGGIYPDPVSCSFGSESISTAYCLEAIVKFMTTDF